MQEEKSSLPEIRKNAQESIRSLNAISDDIAKYLKTMRPLVLRQFVDITLPPPRPEFSEEVVNALRICEIFRIAAERYRPPEKTRRKHRNLH